MDRLGPRDLLIDSSIIIKNLRGSPAAEAFLLEEASESFDNLFVSAISIYEIECGGKTAGRASDIDPFLDYLNVLDVTEEVAKDAALIYAQLKRKKLLIQNRDILIAGTARVYHLPLLTCNISHFARVDGVLAGIRVRDLLAL